MLVLTAGVVLIDGHSPIKDNQCIFCAALNWIFVPGYNIVFPETLEERNSVSRLLNHAQYDGGGFRWPPLLLRSKLKQKNKNKKHAKNTPSMTAEGSGGHQYSCSAASILWNVRRNLQKSYIDRLWLDSLISRQYECLMVKWSDNIWFCRQRDKKPGNQGTEI